MRTSTTRASSTRSSAAKSCSPRRMPAGWPACLPRASSCRRAPSPTCLPTCVACIRARGSSRRAWRARRPSQASQGEGRVKRSPSPLARCRSARSPAATRGSTRMFNLWRASKSHRTSRSLCISHSNLGTRATTLTASGSARARRGCGSSTHPSISPRASSSLSRGRAPLKSTKRQCTSASPNGPHNGTCSWMRRSGRRCAIYSRSLPRPVGSWCCRSSGATATGTGASLGAAACP